MYDYDRYAPMMQNEATITWEEARKMVMDSYTEFHPNMGEITAEFFDKNWIDAAIKPGKRGGAYSASTVPSVHPYVFMNFDGKIRDVQTLAHELGHFMGLGHSGESGNIMFHQYEHGITLADSAIEINATRTALWQCAWEIDQGMDPRAKISALKVQASEMLV